MIKKIDPLLIFLILTNLIFFGCDQDQKKNKSSTKPKTSEQKIQKDNTEKKNEQTASINIGETLAKLNIKTITPTEAKNFTLEDLSGNKVSLKDYRGKIVFLNFWATWCAPCIEEMPGMEKLHKALKEKDFAMITINSGEKKDAVAQFIQSKSVTFPILLDTKNEIVKEYQVKAWPTTILIDKEGKIFSIVTGIGSGSKKRDWGDDLSIKLFQALSEK